MGCVSMPGIERAIVATRLKATVQRWTSRSEARATSVKLVYEGLCSIRSADAQLAMSCGVTSSGSSSSTTAAGVSLASEPALM